MSVYFIRDGELIKIGYSADVETRVAAIINGLRGKGEYLGCMPGGREVEKHLHAVFGAYREFGEWFRVSEPLLAFIGTAAAVRPVGNEMAARDRLLQQEERYAEEAALSIRYFMEDLPPNQHDHAFLRLAELSSVTEARLRAIYAGEACPITSGEYVVLRMIAESVEPPPTEPRQPAPPPDDADD